MTDLPIIVSFLEEDLTESGLDKVRMIHELHEPEKWVDIGQDATIVWPAVVFEAHVDAVGPFAPMKKKRWWR